ncbi:MAG: methyltransferase domain-containing protein [Confluentimicrobium sp.]|jgi:SAM-dependent methyltransferase|uniref:SAM-dependent methyltransferase n=1 Tax=Actibacterium naphthalenivorans TaxID=1614693 RepID=A0A840CFU1_9RHOB|nr:MULTISPECIES: methyltransferase domain-containing protein [Actibacterium]KGB83140.1 ATP synthase [Rhodovulum sp. NI22]MDY6859379.1 methyltransferase domain-containing protein [Pseudomonadota bacterium]ALG89334.1 ATP synthase [Actibacterium sp. EMB200-NS6]MBB4021057.1 SAM-dependent methyltransferase [Actibacterium naphthalenivorans]MBC56361.1 methyltransferase domain-containing protein [Actibacterium sp.]|tara:strand:+ start:208 stop:954 length:747 start_codon:yes stop_codon:yes gene_type:complete
MHLDVLDLRNFYYRTNLGRVAQRAIRDQVKTLWPEAKGQTVVGFGFAAPLLRPYLPEARRVVALMPGQQGVMPWPAGAANVSVLSEETRWPLPNGLADKLVLLHGLETSEHPSALLEECARVLGPGGRALFIVPNRSGLWARRDVTPFGFGRPYSLGQLEGQLKQHGFQPECHRAALYTPPSRKRFWLKSAPMLEKAGRQISGYFAGGVLMVEASKRVYRPTGTGVEEGVARPMRVLEGVTQPGAEPV